MISPRTTYLMRLADSNRAMPSAPATRASTEPSGLGHSASVRIAAICDDLLERQAQRNIEILQGETK